MINLKKKVRISGCVTLQVHLHNVIEHGSVTTRGESILATDALALNGDIWPIFNTKSES